MGSTVSYIETSNPILCRQKEFAYVQLKDCIYTNNTQSLILFPPITARLVCLAALFPAFSIVKIFVTSVR